MANSLPGVYTAGHFKAAFAPTSLGSATVTWYSIGSTEEGWTLETTYHEDEIHDDAFGQAVADTVQEGIDYRVSGVTLNVAAINTAGILASQETPGVVNANCGQLGSAIYGSLCLTPVAGTTAETRIGAGNSYVFYLAAVGNNVSYLLGNMHRKIPVNFRCLPDPAHPGISWAIIATPTGVPTTFP